MTAIAMRILPFLFPFLGAIFGLFGVRFGLLLFIIHLCSLRWGTLYGAGGPLYLAGYEG